jgi:hypothetical protein
LNTVLIFLNSFSSSCTVGYPLQIFLDPSAFSGYEKGTLKPRSGLTKIQER